MDSPGWHLNDRRRAARQSALHDHGIVTTRVRPGHAAVLQNISEWGALIETLHRIVPGAAIGLHLETEERWASIRGLVLRCAVARLSLHGVLYEGAISFDGPLFWLPRNPDGERIRRP